MVVGFLSLFLNWEQSSKREGEFAGEGDFEEDSEVQSAVEFDFGKTVVVVLVLNESCGDWGLFFRVVSDFESISLFRVSLESSGESIFVEPFFPVLVVLSSLLEVLLGLNTNIKIIFFVSQEEFFCGDSFFKEVESSDNSESELSISSSCSVIQGNMLN